METQTSPTTNFCHDYRADTLRIPSCLNMIFYSQSIFHKELILHGIDYIIGISFFHQDFQIIVGSIYQMVINYLSCVKVYHTPYHHPNLEWYILVSSHQDRFH